jgi:RNA polymerase-interacting CarD/CdnL/TRCF family regulator
VREVDQLEDAVDERVAERDERVEGSLRDTDQQDPAEVVRSLDEVDPEPDQNERDEQQTDGARRLGA